VYFLLIKKIKIRIYRKDALPLLVATVFGYALTNLFFTYSILYTQVGNALFLFYTYAIITPVFGYLFLKEKINRTNIIALAVSFIALALLFQPNSLPTWKLGGFFAILSSLGQTAYLILRKKLNKYSASNDGCQYAGWSRRAFRNQPHARKRVLLRGRNRDVSMNTWVATVLFGFDNFLAWFAMTKGFEYFKATAEASYCCRSWYSASSSHFSFSAKYPQALP
jgi:drug/metabolite transporter (DMT)-like permease